MSQTCRHPKAGVEKMLAAMEDEIEQMVLRAQGPQRRILHCRFFRRGQRR